MTIWIDADACPRPVKELVFRASARTGTTVVLVADRPLATPPSALVTSVRVKPGLDAADHHIADQAAPGDLVVTADLPLAAEVVGLGATAVNPRGELYTEENVRERLSMRDFMMSLREADPISGQNLGGPPPFNNRDKQRFAAALERFLHAAL